MSKIVKDPYDIFGPRWTEIEDLSTRDIKEVFEDKGTSAEYLKKQLCGGTDQFFEDRLTKMYSIVRGMKTFPKFANRGSCQEYVQKMYDKAQGKKKPRSRKPKQAKELKEKKKKRASHRPSTAFCPDKITLHIKSRETTRMIEFQPVRQKTGKDMPEWVSEGQKQSKEKREEKKVMQKAIKAAEAEMIKEEKAAEKKPSPKKKAPSPKKKSPKKKSSPKKKAPSPKKKSPKKKSSPKKKAPSPKKTMSEKEFIPA